ncbi:zona pellucida sperm-binding protein 4-like [Takifugu flavidus]|uniref:Zona pellucida sperm-binding protein 4 n=1 Tax=Takifugu flavidus TaxID=433684 RepID=A0A5C6P4Y3_9TELE|nr:zona pellucida sperm-binding protein 4-like [Takifugu flavidus]TWW73938.1 Zona pellucida sperm-binding protein 4 [Takifugu flavidus]
MEQCKCLFGVVVVVLLACDVTAWRQWMPPVEKVQPQHPLQQPNVSPPTDLVDKCQVEEGQKIRCGTQDVTAEECDHINCCFDGSQCYYGKAVTVQCTSDGQFVVVVARDATWPHMDVDSISLLDTNDPSCTTVDFTTAFAIFQFPVAACGTTMSEEDGYIVYENHMSSSYEVGVGPRGSITRDSHFELLFQCRYSGTAVEALIMEVNDLPPPLAIAAIGPLRVELKLASGECHSKGCRPEESAYSSFYTPAEYPITKLLREEIFVQVNLVERADPNIVLNLEHCWATSTPSPHSFPQWDLLINGCPYGDDHYLTKVVQVDGSSGLQHPNHYKRFTFKMFAFVDNDTMNVQKDTVFIHCNTAVCHPSSTNSCAQPCHRQRRAVATWVPSSQKGFVSSGQIIITKSR